jgi:hypothetical protein
MTFPPSFRRFLSEVGPFVVEFEVTPKRQSWLLVYGLLGVRIGLPNLLWAASLRRSDDARRYLSIANLTGYEDHFALDTNTVTAAGELAVVSGGGYQGWGSPVADSFGQWLHAQLLDLLPRSQQMWDSWLAATVHNAEALEYSEPGHPYYASCSCGWNGNLTGQGAAEREAAMHSRHPQEIRQERYWWNS